MHSTLAVLVASLAELAAVDADVGVRGDALADGVADSRASATRRTSLSVVPTAAAILEAGPLRLTTTYAPRLWMSDVEAQQTLLVTQAGEARVRTRDTRTWSMEAMASAARGRTDPLLHPSSTATLPGATQVTTVRALGYEELQGGLAGELAAGPRTTLSAATRWQRSRAIGQDAELLPSQRGVSFDAAVLRLVTERDALRVAATATSTVTEPAAIAPTHSGSAAAVATWRRRVGPRTDGWVGAGASWLYSDQLRPELRPAGEVGLARAGQGLGPSVEATLRATTFIDRFTGEVSPSLDARCGVAWPVSERLSFFGSASGGGRTDGATAVAGADARAAWLLRPTLTLELGVLARAQHERRLERPSFVEAAAFVAFAFRRERLFGTAASATPAAEPAP